MAKREIFNDGSNTIEFKPNTNKVVVGKNTSSHFKSSYKSFKAMSKEQAMEIGIKHLGSLVGENKIMPKERLESAKEDDECSEGFDDEVLPMGVQYHKIHGGYLRKEERLNLNDAARKWYKRSVYPNGHFDSVMAEKIFSVIGTYEEAPFDYSRANTPELILSLWIVHEPEQVKNYILSILSVNF